MDITVGLPYAVHLSLVPGFDGPNALCKRLFSNALADGTEHEAERKRPLRFLPSRMKTTSMPVVPSG
jgi:hypothetical protein